MLESGVGRRTRTLPSSGGLLASTIGVELVASFEASPAIAEAW